MNTMTELLMSEINDARIAERRAEADARRLVSVGTPTERPARTRNLVVLLRRATLGPTAFRPL